VLWKGSLVHMCFRQDCVLEIRFSIFLLSLGQGR
jgi:hypothetical protein